MIEVFKITDIPTILSVLTDPDIFATISEDGIKPEDLKIDVDSQCWLAMVSSSKFLGLYNLKPLSGVCLDIHAHVLPEFRKEHSKETGRAALQWIYANAPKYHKVEARIPVCYKNVRDFTCSFGFKEEGLSRLSYRKNGMLHDQYLLGITRGEIEAFLNG